MSAKHYSVQSVFSLRDATKVRVKTRRSRPLKSVVKFGMTDEQVDWMVRSNPLLAYAMSQGG